jgi:hypothetical protein
MTEAMRMSYGGQGQGQDDICVLTEAVNNLWRKTRPKLMGLYDEMDQSQKRTREAAQTWQDTIEHLQQLGVPHDQAKSLAMLERIDLPDLEDSDVTKMRSDLLKQVG